MNKHANMPLSLQLAYLYTKWYTDDGFPDRYSAYIHFLTLWLWDGKDISLFPTTQAKDLIDMSRNVTRQTRSVALIGITMLVMRFGDRLPQFVKDAFVQWAEKDHLREEFIEVQKYYITSVTGLQIQKKLHDEVFVQLQKEQQILRDKLGMTDDEETRMELTEEGNKKMQSFAKRLSNLAKDGIDMNVSTFGQLRSIDFLKDLENWFIDFEITHPELKQLGDKLPLAKALFNHAELCDLDKYAMSLMIDKLQTPENLLKQLPVDLLNRMQDDFDVRDAYLEEREDNAYRYTFQTLFRFFLYSPWASELVNPFKMEPFLADYSILSPIIGDKFLLESAKLFVQNSFNNHAKAHLRSWIQRNEKTNEALELLALCHKHTGENKERLECLEELGSRHPDDLHLVQETGLCLINEKRYEEALQRFFHLEVKEHYLRGSARAIAWCSLLTGNYTRSQRYYAKLLKWEGGPSWEDLLNAGHSAWVSGDPVEASRLYTHYLNQHADNLQAFDNDHQVLLSLGISEEDIALMRETISI